MTDDDGKRSHGQGGSPDQFSADEALKNAENCALEGNTKGYAIWLLLSEFLREVEDDFKRVSPGHGPS